VPGLRLQHADLLFVAGQRGTPTPVFFLLEHKAGSA